MTRTEEIIKKWQAEQDRLLERARFCSEHNFPHEKDFIMEKYNTATSMGWRVFRTTPNDLYNSKTLNMLKNAILGCFSPENDTL